LLDVGRFLEREEVKEKVESESGGERAIEVSSPLPRCRFPSHSEADFPPERTSKKSKTFAETEAKTKIFQGARPEKGLRFERNKEKRVESRSSPLSSLETPTSSLFSLIIFSQLPLQTASFSFQTKPRGPGC